MSKLPRMETVTVEIAATNGSASKNLQSLGQPFRVIGMDVQLFATRSSVQQRITEYDTAAEFVSLQIQDIGGSGMTFANEPVSIYTFRQFTAGPLFVPFTLNANSTLKFSCAHVGTNFESVDVEITLFGEIEEGA